MWGDISAVASPALLAPEVPDAYRPGRHHSRMEHTNHSASSLLEAAARPRRGWELWEEATACFMTTWRRGGDLRWGMEGWGGCWTPGCWQNFYLRTMEADSPSLPLAASVVEEELGFEVTAERGTSPSLTESMLVRDSLPDAGQRQWNQEGDLRLESRRTGAAGAGHTNQQLLLFWGIFSPPGHSLWEARATWARCCGRILTQLSDWKSSRLLYFPPLADKAWGFRSWSCWLEGGEENTTEHC